MCPTVRRIRFDQIKETLEEAKSVSLAAHMLGMSQPALSRFLNRKCRAAWWRATKRRWSKERKRARNARCIANKAAREAAAIAEVRARIAADNRVDSLNTVIWVD